MGTSYQPTPQGQASVGGGVRRRKPLLQQSTQTAQPPQQPQQPQTFAQMQAQGQARPAPQQYQPQGPPNVQGELQTAVSQALRTPSRYDMGQVQQVRGALTGQLGQEFGAQRKKLDEELARRGISSSSVASGYLGDLAGQHGTALAGLDAKLIQDFAATQAADREAALGAGQRYQEFEAGQGLREKEFGLAEKLGLGNLTLAQAAQKLDEQVRTGQLTLDQRDQALREKQNEQQYGLAGRELGLKESQFGEGKRQFDIAQQLERELGMGGLGVQQRQAETARLAQEADARYQAGQITLQERDQELDRLKNEQQYGLQRDEYGLRRDQFGESTRQFDKSLSQQEAEARQRDVLGHRGIDVDKYAQELANQRWYADWTAQHGAAEGGTGGTLQSRIERMRADAERRRQAAAAGGAVGGNPYA